MTTVAARPDAQELRAEIARTRAALGETVEALAAKADVKARVSAHLKQKANDVRGRARDRVRALAGQAQARAGVVAGRVRAQASHAAGEVAGRAGRAAGTVNAAVHDPALRAKLRRPVPMAAVGTAAAATAAVAVFALRTRRR
ncbi:DUF3618 domain-containing protein [Dactylosporangium sp. CA-052675]|uniref:DUF3618 domain-containing protein n=1 Tax=Dactylosporangium sp. CA-052675 TaxID=3239927 RepID=UPI003D90FB66